MKNFLFVTFSLLLVSCAQTPTAQCIDCVKAPTTLLIPNAFNTVHLQLEPITHLVTEQQAAQKTAPKPLAVKNEISQLFNDLSAKVTQKWGEQGYVQSSKHRLIKYFDDYQTKADIAFDKGSITIATIAADDAEQKLRDAIIQVLLMPKNAEHISLFTSEKISGHPGEEGLLLLGQVVDTDNKPIEWQWRAERFADHLIQHQLELQAYGKLNAKQIHIKMVADHLAIREKIYAPEVQRASVQYAFADELINALIRTESSFNPFSISSTGGIGLMQIVPATAGKDVFAQVKKTAGVPSTSYLFNPTNNIDVGSAYLHLIATRYLGKITNPQSQQLAAISAYNSGASNVLLTFDQSKQKAVDVINLQTPKQVYELLVTRHPKSEARSYLRKIMSTHHSLI